MSDYRFLLLAACLFYAAYRYAIQPRAVKSQFPETVVGQSPTFALRLLGLLLVAVAILLVYVFISH